LLFFAQFSPSFLPREKVYKLTVVVIYSPVGLSRGLFYPHLYFIGGGFIALKLCSIINYMINYEDFNKLDVRIGTILEAEKVEGADKLLKLLVDIGGEKRTLVAGIAETYTPEEIIGKQIPILTNLEPKKFRGIESQGMILAVDIEGKATLIHPDKKVPNGSRVR